MSTPVSPAFADGSMVLFRDQATDADPAKIHPIQWWRTPFADTDHVPDAGDDNPWMQRVGNAALVDSANAICIGSGVRDKTQSSGRGVVAVRRCCLNSQIAHCIERTG